MNCLCEFLSNVWCQALGQQQQHSSSMESVLERLTSRQVQLEVQDRRCICEARRYHSSASRSLFRAKMLEHRRLQTQLLQLHRVRENVIVQIDAARNHAINQTYVHAVRGMTELNKGGLNREDVESTFEGLTESMQSIRDVSDMLSHPLVPDVTEEELEQEFMDEIAQEPITEEKPAISSTISSPPVLVLPSTMVAALN